MNKLEKEQEARVEISKDACSVQADIYPSKPDMKISDFIKRDDTPGNVGVCLSGGGSTAMISALGQLRALNHLKLLDKVKAISTVSGGSWATIPFTYLPDDISDKDFLNEFVENPHDLTLDDSDKPTSLNYLPKGNMGQVVASNNMKWNNLAFQATKLWLGSKVGLFNMHKMWTYIVARYILKPFKLAKFSWHAIQKPSWFAYDKKAEKEIKKQNQDIPGECYTYQLGKDRIKRPFHLCNGSMFINPNNDEDNKVDLLAPLQSNAFTTGILGNLNSPDTGGALGGGMVSSYAFDSVVESNNGNKVKVKQNDPFSLADITGTSSAFFATGLKEKLGDIDPRFNYWPVSKPKKEESRAYNFADGGCMEDSGIPNLLAFNDIDNVVSFSNALQPVYIDKENQETLNIVIDMWIPPLFGYTPYQAIKNKKKKGYILYKDIPEAIKDFIYPYFQKNQIFDSSRFEEVCRKLHSNCKNYEEPAAYKQTDLELLSNSWYGIAGGRKVNVLWVHYNPVLRWEKELKPEVKEKLDEYVEKTNKSYRNKITKFIFPTNPVDEMFPNFCILQTHMPKYIVNLFAHQTAWITNQLKGSLRPMFDEQ